MRLSATRFNDFLSGAVRQRFTWRRRSACPCIDPSTSAPRYDCPLCRGKGHLWADEVEGFAGQSSQSPAKAIATFGSWERGDCTLTLPSNSPIYDAGQYDRIRSLDSVGSFSEVVRPGLNDALLGKVVCLHRVFWLNDGGTAVVEGPVPDLAADGTMTWPNLDGPPEGRQYTVEGERYDEWFVYMPLAADRNSGASGLPRKLAARRLDILLR